MKLESIDFPEELYCISGRSNGSKAGITMQLDVECPHCCAEIQRERERERERGRERERERGRERERERYAVIHVHVYNRGRGDIMPQREKHKRERMDW